MPSPSRSAAPCRAIAGRPPPTSAEPLPGEVSQQVVGFGAFAALERGKPTGEGRVVRIAEFFLVDSLDDQGRGKADALGAGDVVGQRVAHRQDRKSTRLN